MRLDEGVLIVWPDFGQGMDAITTPGVPQFVLDLAMSPVAMALGVPAGDGSLLAEARGVAEGPKGFILRGTDPNRLQQWLDNGADEALSAEADWLGNKDSANHLIIAVIWKHGLQIATPYGVNDLDHFARVARLGARLAKAHGG